MNKETPRFNEKNEKAPDPVSRRKFLKRVLAASAAGAGATAMGVLEGAFKPKADEALEKIKPTYDEEKTSEVPDRAEEEPQTESDRRWYANHFLFMESVRKGGRESIMLAATSLAFFKEELAKKRLFQQDVINYANLYPQNRRLQAGVENIIHALGEQQAWLEAMVAELGSVPEVNAYLESEEARRKKQMGERGGGQEISDRYSNI